MSFLSMGGKGNVNSDRKKRGHRNLPKKKDRPRVKKLVEADVQQGGRGEKNEQKALLREKKVKDRRAEKGKKTRWSRL